MKSKIIAITIVIIAIYSQATFARGNTVTDNHFITVDEITLHYRTGGSGPVLLLLHGFTLSSEQWSPFFDEFAREYTVIAMDMPGHGKSDMLGSTFSFEKWADIMIKMLDQMGMENVKAIGHSAGAITLMHMTVQKSDIIDSMILVGGAHLYTENAREDLRYDSFEKSSKAFRQYYMEIHSEDTARISAMFNDINHLADQIPVSLNDDAVLNEQTLANMTMPVLLVWGDRDFYFPIHIAVELYQLLPNASIWVIPGQGHAPVWTFLRGDETAETTFPKRVVEFFR